MLIAYAQIPPINTHTDTSSEARCLNIGMSLHIIISILCVNEQGRALAISIEISGTGPFGKVVFFFFRTLTGENNYG